MKKEYRLKKNHEIASIVLKRQRVSSEHFVVYYLNNKENEDKINEINTKVAISVSKKYGKAFERNKAKRYVREIIRPALSLFNNKKIVIVIKTNSKGIKFNLLKEELLMLMKRVNKKGEKNEQKNN